MTLALIVSWFASAPEALADATVIATGIPGPLDPSGSAGLLAYIQNLYLIALAVAGALALVSIVYGAISYTASQGNPTKLAEAWDRILQALIGIVLLVGAGTILTVVNPGLTTLSLPKLVPVTARDVETYRTGQLPELSLFERQDFDGNKISVSRADAKCDTPQTDPKNACYTENFKNKGCDWNPELMSRICKQESAGGQASIVSTCDVCEDKTGFSVGLMQINLVSHGLPGSVIYEKLPEKCRGLFNANFSNGNPARSSTPRPGSPSVCPYRQCSLKEGRREDYKACLSYLGNVSNNISLGCTLYNARRDGPRKYCDWPHSYNICAGQGKQC